MSTSFTVLSPLASRNLLYVFLLRASRFTNAPTVGSFGRSRNLVLTKIQLVGSIWGADQEPTSCSPNEEPSDNQLTYNWYQQES